MKAFLPHTVDVSTVFRVCRTYGSSSRHGQSLLTVPEAMGNFKNRILQDLLALFQTLYKRKGKD
jgi:hypothetical protein